MKIPDDARLMALVEVHEASDLQPHEAFVMVQVARGSMTMRMARQVFRSLGFDVDEVIRGLARRRLLQIEGSTLEETSSSAILDEANHSTPIPNTIEMGEMISVPEEELHGTTEARSSFAHARRVRERSRASQTSLDSSLHPRPGIGAENSWISDFAAESRPATARTSSLVGSEFADRTRVFERVRDYEDEGKLQHAIALLRRAVEARPREVPYFHRLSQLYLATNALEEALEAIRNALQLEPQKKNLHVTRDAIEAAIRQREITLVYGTDWPGCQARFLRFEPGLRRIWVELRFRDRLGIGSINLLSGKMDAINYAENPRDFSIVRTDHPKFSAFSERTLTASTSASRSSLLQQLRRSRENGPWFRRGIAPVASSSTSLHLVFDRNPNNALEEGLFTLMEGLSSPVRIDPVNAKITNVRFSPDDNFVAWSGQEIGARWGVYIATPISRGSRRIELSGPSFLEWDSATHGVYAVDRFTPTLYYVPRSGDWKLLSTFDMDEVLFFEVDELVQRAVVSGSRRSKYVLAWIDLTDGTVLAEHLTNRPVSPDHLRSDGVLVSVRNSGLGILHLETGERGLARVQNLDRDSVRLTQWGPDQPLYALGETKDRIEIWSIGVDQFV